MRLIVLHGLLSDTLLAFVSCVERVLPRWTTAPDAVNTVGTPKTPPPASFRLRFLVNIGFHPSLFEFDGADVYTPADKFFGFASPAKSALRRLPVELLSC